MARNDLDAAVAEFSKAIGLAPAEPRYLDQRAQAYLRQDKSKLARADLDRLLALKPTDVDALLARASLKQADGDRSGSVADLDAADCALEPVAMARLELGGLLTEAGEPQRAIGDFDQWLKAHPDDVRRPEALNDRCWARALWGQELDTALRDCDDAALRARPGLPGFLDSRGLVKLRLGDAVKAIADYDAALAREPKLAWSLYGGGLARLRTGDAVEGRRTSPPRRRSVHRSPTRPRSSA